MKTALIEFVKNNKFVYYSYYYVMTCLINCLKLFMKTDNKLILFVSYGGRHFNDSPKCIYDAMKLDPRFNGYTLVWAFRNPEQFDVPNKIKIDSFLYYKTALKARAWVTNVFMERGLNFRGKNTYYLHTTHTVLPKMMGIHAVKAGCENFALPCKYKYDCSCAQSVYEQKLQSEIFEIPEENVKLTGYPKNDIIASYPDNKKAEIREELGITPEKRVILYAPTYRDEKNNREACPINFDLWHKILGNEYVILFRAHPILISLTKIDPSSSFVKDVSSYPYNSDLMAISDILISDYSGIFFEFGVQDKPMFCYGYDYEEYIKKRQLYFDIRQEIPGGMMSERELLEYIKSGNKNEIMKKVEIFRNKYITVYGNATRNCLDLIYNNIQ